MNEPSMHLFWQADPGNNNQTSRFSLKLLKAFLTATSQESEEKKESKNDDDDQEEAEVDGCWVFRRQILFYVKSEDLLRVD